jgi:hypothetical protein
MILPWAFSGEGLELDEAIGQAMELVHEDDDWQYNTRLISVHPQTIVTLTEYGRLWYTYTITFITESLS